MVFKVKKIRFEIVHGDLSRILEGLALFSLVEPP
jgi:hypothetical protein